MLEPKAKACPFCGNEWASLRNAGNNGVLRQVYCREVDCGARGPIRPSDDHAVAAWNNRAGDRQPTASKPEEIKALASATCSAAGVKIKHVFQIELVPKQKRELRKIWDDFAVDGGMILMQPILQWGPFEIQKCRAQGFVINKEGAAEINATVAKAQQPNGQLEPRR